MRHVTLALALDQWDPKWVRQAAVGAGQSSAITGRVVATTNRYEYFGASSVDAALNISEPRAPLPSDELFTVRDGKVEIASRLSI